MIISHRYKFIFIKTRKTAGTSIEAFLGAHCGDDDVVTPIHPPLDGHRPRNYRGVFNPLPEFAADETLMARARTLKHFLLAERFYNHMPARLVQLRLPPDVFDGYFKFCVERNPWDKTLSYYHMAAHRAGSDLTWDEFIRRGRFPVDHPLYTDSSGKLLVDRVVRYEHLMADLGEIFEMLGVPFSGSLGIKAKGEYRRDRRPYQEAYTDAQRAAIAEAFATEIQLFGYHF